MYIGCNAWEFVRLEDAALVRGELRKWGITSWLLRPSGCCYSWAVVIVSGGSPKE